MRKQHHHLKYKEIDGKDEYILIGSSEHTKLNHIAAKQRGRIPKTILFRARDRIRYKNELFFDTQIEKRSSLKERIRYNPNTGHVGYLCYWLRN